MTERKIASYSTIPEQERRLAERQMQLFGTVEPRLAHVAEAHERYLRDGI